MYIFFITLFGFIIRLNHIIKPEGLWNDEYVSWYIANIPLGSDFWAAVKTQCHMPLYYFYLKFMMLLGGNSDLFLRITSVIPAVIAIPVMYFAGVELDKENKNVARVSAIITAVSSFLIYYSQEVRLYSLLFLFSALAWLFALKTINNLSKKNIAGFIIFNLLIILTHTIGFVFVFFNVVYLFSKLWSQKQISSKKIIVISSVIGLPLLISLPLILNTFSMSGIAQWWGKFTIRNIGFLMTDYFSPVLTNLVNAPNTFFYKHDFVFILYMLIPPIAALIALIKGAKKHKGMFLVAFGGIFILSMAAILGKLVFITKYSIEIYPILILLVSVGFNSFSKYNIGKFLFILWLLPNLLFISNDKFATKIKRTEGHKIVADLLNMAEIKPGDTVIITYYNEYRFAKYIDLTKYNVHTVNKANIKRYYNLADDKIYPEKENFIALEKNLNDRIVKNYRNNVYIVFLDSLEFFTPQQINQILNTEELIEKVPVNYILFSGLKNQLISSGIKKYKYRSFISKGDWTVLMFKN
ncbi:glycosyltransferase family 39 protein [bacterium]|nr:glycosyltransferase family 39 protein [bacterium]